MAACAAQSSTTCGAAAVRARASRRSVPSADRDPALKPDESGSTRPQDLLEYERRFWGRGRLVAGVDEAGRGPLAGPVVAAAVVLPEGVHVEGADDSKQLSRETREELLSNLREALNEAIEMNREDARKAAGEQFEEVALQP